MALPVWALSVFIILPVITSTSNDTICDAETGGDCTYRESIEDNAQVRRIVASGCPNYATADISQNRNSAVPQHKNLSLAAQPCFSDKAPLDLVCVASAVGITLNGISIFSQFAGGECTADNDAVVLEGDSFDSCAGHASGKGDYHYHTAPACLLAQLNDTDDLARSHSPLIGWAFDGFPVYGPHGTSGELMFGCTHASANGTDCVDACNGHSQHTIDGYLFHYHILGPIGDGTSTPLQPLPSTEMRPYTIGCLKGVPLDWSVLKVADNGAQCAANGTVVGFAPKETDGVTRVYTAKHSEAPNVIFFLFDDLGFGDVGFNGGSYPTPVLDALSSEKAIRLNFHYTEALCSPTRSALYTGRYAWKSGLASTTGINSHKHVDRDAVFFTQLLRNHSYQTFLAGYDYDRRRCVCPALCMVADCAENGTLVTNTTTCCPLIEDTPTDSMRDKARNTTLDNMQTR